MLWPTILPLNTLIETLHRDRNEMKKKFKFFWIIFSVVAVWELLPEYIMPLLTGISMFCLFNQRSMLVTNLFGGTSGNEGLGFMSFCFDWQYIGTSALFIPLRTQANAAVGWIGCMALFMGLYYGNVWRAMDFPFLSQLLFSQDSNSTVYSVYNQSTILDANNELDVAKLNLSGVPFFTATNAAYLLTTNLSIGATVIHIILWDFAAVKNAFAFASLSNLKEIPSRMMFWKPGQRVHEKEDTEKDPHYLAMRAYAEVPSWWYILILIASYAIALFSIYNLKSTLPWWGFMIATLLSFLATLFFGALSGVLGFNVPITSVIQLIGGYLHPGKPMANMYFVLFGANAQAQALFLVSNLKLGQYGKLSPRCCFAVQIIGTLLGAIINYALMSSITTNQRDILLSIQGTNIWSGQVIQSFNSNVSSGLLV